MQFQLDFGKPNCSEANPVHQEVDAVLVSGPWTRASPAGDRVELLTGVAFPGDVHTTYGAPGAVWLTVSLPTNPADNTLRLTVASYNKTATRLGEGFFLRFNVSQPAGWLVDKLGSWVDPTDTVTGGNQHHHGVLGGLRAARADGSSLTVASPQAGLVAVGKLFALPTPWDGPPAAADGAAFLLEDNTWGTNYAMWSPALPSPYGGDDANQMWQFDVSLE